MSSNQTRTLIYDLFFANPRHRVVVICPNVMWHVHQFIENGFLWEIAEDDLSNMCGIWYDQTIVVCRINTLIVPAMPYNPYLTAWELARVYPTILQEELRNILVPRFSWAIPTESVLATIARYTPLIEVGAGTGYWADLLQRRHVDILPLDSAPPQHTWVPVMGGRGEWLISCYAARTLMLCWPPAGSPMAAQTLERYRGSTVVYIGEPRGGSTGDEAFHDALAREWDAIERVTLPQWPSARDSLTIFRRRC
jgi:hypothetical protein